MFYFLNYLLFISKCKGNELSLFHIFKIGNKINIFSHEQ